MPGRPRPGLLLNLMKSKDLHTRSNSKMKLIPGFLIAVFFSAALILSYITWTTLNRRNSLLDKDPQIPHLIPQLRSIQSILPGLSSVDEESLSPDSLKNAERMRMKIVSNLRRHVIDGSGFKGHINHYGVNFTQLKRRTVQEVKEMMCRIKKLNLGIIREKSSPLFKGKQFPEENLLTGLNLFGRPDKLYTTCAVIPNSAALDGSLHGIDIDSHDFVLRFNDAPTVGHENDVGKLTSMRIVNSQVVTKPEFKFPEGNVWEGTKKFLMWDPCNYTSTIEQWMNNPDFPIFDKYFNLTSRVKNKFYLLDCRVIWRLWELLFEYTFARIYGTPPTSGFIGIALAMQNCERVNVYEYIPSVRESTRCHYYGPIDPNPSCTYGSWHPVSAEKLFYLALTDSPDKQIFMDGVLSLPGVSNVDC